jgi:two-component system C4-dicarboxylate transport sensor histidine kinase DctB
VLRKRRLKLPVIAYCAAACALVAVVYSLAFRAGLSALKTSGQISLVQSQDRLLSQLEAFQELSNFLARHPDIVNTARGLIAPQDLNELLLRHALASGAGDVYMLDQTGTVVASSNFEDSASFIGLDFQDRPDVISAKTGRLGVYHGIEPADKTRDFFYTRGVLTDGNQAEAFIVVKVDASLLEFNWRIDDKILTFVDEDGVAFLANRAGLLMRQDVPAPTRYPDEVVKAAHPFSQQSIGEFDIQRFESGLGLPREALIIERDILLINMTARLYLDTTDARNRAKLQAALAAALMAVLGLYIMNVSQHRRRMSDKLRIEEEANADLEARVAKRTQQLERTQADLIQASKLTALGQMSAGISHELAQPLSTIQNYAENSTKLLDRDRTGDAQENLLRISEQATRMGRIIQNLRAFARKETEPLEAVEMNEVLTASIALAQQPMLDAGVTLLRTGDTRPIFVQAGKVRLQQVVVNLLSNAIDAMIGQPTRHITLDLQVDDQVRVTIRDTGPGLADPKRVFEPFYTTKDIGMSKGLGLGLSISYGIVGSFGGTLSATNTQDGGAIFTISLPEYAPGDQT